MNILIAFYSMYGHIHAMAQSFAQGVNEVAGARAVLRRVPETLPPSVLEKMGAVEPQKQWAHIPVCEVEELAGAAPSS